MEKTIKNYFIEVEQDTSPTCPREDDNLGKMICFHRRYSLGDKHDWDFKDYDSWEEMKTAIIRNVDTAVILPLYLYDHSGITMNTTGFSCSWDSGQVGWIFISKEKVRKEYSVKRISKKLLERIEKYLIAEVDTYDKYLTGDVYGYKISKITKDENGEEEKFEIDSCSGIYGEDECMAEAESLVKHYLTPQQLELNL